MILSAKGQNGKPARTVVITICCREKDNRPEPLAAVERYRSERIQSLHRLSRQAGLPFLILSGRFGLLEPDAPIPYYDYLLEEKDIVPLSLKIGRDLSRKEISKIIYFLPDPVRDPKVIPYREAIRRAAAGRGIELEIRIIPPLPSSI